MSLRVVAIILAIAMIGIFAYGTYRQVNYPAQVVSTGNLEVDNPRGGSPAKIRLLTRTVSIGGTVRSEIELPNGTWIDCSGDCAGAARKTTIDFWDEQRKNKR